MDKKQIIPEAFFDSLSLAKKLDDFLDGFKKEEIQLFAYFSLILHAYKGKDVSSWGYSFIVDENGFPFSKELNDAIERHIKNAFGEREKVISASCTTSILIPFSQTRDALLHDPGLVKAKALGGKREIEKSIYSKFKEVSDAIGSPVAEDYIIPALSWINYIRVETGTNKGEQL